MEQKIYSLSPDYTELLDNRFEKNDFEKSYVVYKNNLDQAFTNRKIRNIAITGNYGVGKSTILQKYADERGKVQFVSVCELLENCNADNLVDIENRLIYQLFMMSKKNSFYDAYLPFYSKAIKRILCALSITLLISILFLYLFSKSSSYFEVIIPLLADYYSYVYAILYFVLILSAGVLIVVLICTMFNKWRVKKVSIKNNYTEIGMELVSPFKRYRSELVFSLVDNIKRIDTIIFEDMDRLPPNICIEAFEKLSDINYLINGRLKDTNNVLRFLYVVQDGIFEKVGEKQNNASNNNFLHLKFFDYILPIVPALNYVSSETFIEKVFNTIDFKVETNERVSFISLISSYLTDYRLIYNVANEYNVFKEINKCMNKPGLEKSIMNHKSINDIEIMAFVIYKNLLPLDYEKIREKESSVFCQVENASHKHSDKKYDNYSLIDTMKEKGWLNLNCLLLAGFSNKELECYWKHIFINADADNRMALLNKEPLWCCSELDKMESDDVCNALKDIECKALLTLLSENIKKYDFLKRYDKHDVIKEMPEYWNKKMKNHFFKIDEHVLSYLIRIGCKEYEWFFPSSTDNDERHIFAIDILCKLNENELSCLHKRCMHANENYFHKWINTSNLYAKLKNTKLVISKVFFQFVQSLDDIEPDVKVDLKYLVIEGDK